jgi:hypothetical protein
MVKPTAGIGIKTAIGVNSAIGVKNGIGVKKVNSKGLDLLSSEVRSKNFRLK